MLMLFRNYKGYLFWAGISFLFILIIFASTVGSAGISLKKSFYVLVKNIPITSTFLSNNLIDETSQLIILQIRLPRIFLSIFVGMGLSVVGNSFQAVFRNPMADPYILGVSSGAGVGAAVAIVLASQNTILAAPMITICAFIGALITMILVYRIAAVGYKIPTAALLLSGVGVNLFFSSILTIIMVFYRNQIEAIFMWMLGSFNAASWNQVFIIAPVIFIGSTILFLYSRDIDILSTGEEAAVSLGIENEKVKKILFVVTSLMISTCVASSGIIGFVGLIVPHFVKMIVGVNHREGILFSALFGAVFMLLADTLSRTLLAPIELPVGAVTALLGAPFFLMILVTKKQQVI